MPPDRRNRPHSGGRPPVAGGEDRASGLDDDGMGTDGTIGDDKGEGRWRLRMSAGTLAGVYFNYRQKGIASVAFIKFRGEGGVGGQQLLVDAGITMQPDSTPSPPKIFSVGGQLSVGGAPVAPLQGAFVFWPCFPDYSQKNDVSLRAFLSHQQVRAVDERRSADGGFVLDVQLVAGILGLDGLSHAPLTVQEKVTGSDWSRILKEMKFEDRATFEVPIEGGLVGPPLDKAAAYMREALNRLEMRQWDDALTKCREVLTELQQFLAAPAPAWADWADKAKREGWGLLERVGAAQAAVRHMTHAGPHGAIGSPNEREVRLVVAVTGAFLRYHASR